MQVDVAILPQYAQDLAGRVCVVIDVIRAGTTLVTMFEAGAPAVHFAASADDALAASPQLNLLHHLRCCLGRRKGWASSTSLAHAYQDDGSEGPRCILTR